MKSVKSDAITWIINDKISVTFHKLHGEESTDAFSVSPSGTRVRIDNLNHWYTFPYEGSAYHNLFTCSSKTIFYVEDGQQIWKCTRDGVTLENQHKKLCEYFMGNGVLFEFDGNSTYLLLKNRRDPLTHDKEAWERMVSSGALKIIHDSGRRKLATMAKETELPISAEYERTLLEVCK
jgi:hypothetical protein